MKKLLLILILLAGLHQVKGQVQRNVLIEQFTGTWCGNCPNAIDLINKDMAEYPGTIIYLALHGPNIPSDTMANIFTENLNDGYWGQGGNQSLSYPGVMVDRADWSSFE